MKAILEPRITETNNQFSAMCACGKIVLFSSKSGALKMLTRGNCRNCADDYRSVKGKDANIYKNSSGKWCSSCSGCNAEQEYTRKDHAKQSELSDWQCKKCVSSAKRFHANRPVGDFGRLFNKFRKSANQRGIYWDLTENEMFSGFNGICQLTGWHISTEYTNTTASLDRINSSIGYIPENIQWVHSMVNMCKNKYDQSAFIAMCKAVSANH